VGDVHVLYQVGEGAVLFGGVSQSFRAPGMDDTSSFRQRTGGQSLDLPSPDLDPERGVQLEAGARIRNGRWAAGVSAFYTYLYDLIRRVPTIDVDSNGSIDSPKQNVSSGEVHGIEGYFQAPLGEEITLWAGVSWSEGYAENPAEPGSPMRPLSKVNPVTGVVKIKYSPADAPYWVEAVVLMSAEQDHLSPDDRTDNRIPPGGTPGFTVLTLRGGVRLNEHVSATLSLENLTDADYRFHGSGQNEPGFNAIGGVDIRY
jgi:hemoglobin/transferrin/lactoferrin receptor protein